MPRRDFAALFMATVLAVAGAGGWLVRTFQPVIQAPVDDSRIMAAAEREPGAWLVHGHTPAEQRFSPLTEIDTATVAELGLVWAVGFEGEAVLVGAPLVAGDRLYVADSAGVTHALDAGDGREIWRFVPEAATDAAPRDCCGGGHGVALYGRRVFVGAADGRLLALRTWDGDVVWAAEPVRDGAGQPLPLAAAPRVGDDKVFVAYGWPGRPGEVHAYDAAGDGLAWRHRIGADEGSHGGTDVHGISGAIAYDPELNRVYFDAVAPAARDTHASAGVRGWAVVALDAATGSVAWRHVGKYGGGGARGLVLADVELGGASHLALLRVAPNGLSQVIDRRGGALLTEQPQAPFSQAGQRSRRTPAAVRWRRTAAPAGDWPAPAFDARSKRLYLPLLVPPELRAFEPLTGVAPWSVATGAAGAGVLATAGGLVFQGDSSGVFIAYDAAGGTVLWRFATGAPIHAPPITYAAAGAQHVALLVSPGNDAGAPTPARLLAFALGGAAAMPEPGRGAGE